jgi:purine-binding chemotaxis protein CheW
MTRTGPAATPTAEGELISMSLGDQLVGIRVATVQDVLGPQRLTPIPRAAVEVGGMLNLRGRIVTAIDLRTRLGMPPREPDTQPMSVVVEKGGELYSLVIDQVGDVLQPPADCFDADVRALGPRWREVALGIYRLDERLLVLLDVDRILELQGAAA